MAVIPIVTGPTNKTLRTKSQPVKKIDKNIKKIIADMTDTLFDCDGLGIAAPQIGINLRIFVARLNFGTKNETVVPMLNSRLHKISEEKQIGEEGCLSVPGKFGTVERAKKVTIEYMDLKGKKNILVLSDLNARLMQHETDHLDGILFVDKMIKEVDSGAMKNRKDVI